MKEIAEMAVRIYSETDLDTEESVLAATEIWNRAHGTFVEPETEPDTTKKESSHWFLLLLLPPVVALGIMVCLDHKAKTDRPKVEQSGDLHSDAEHFSWATPLARSSLGDESEKCAIIHEKSGCQKGYTREREPRFIEKDGSRQFACISDTERHNCTDFLRPGESEEFSFSLQRDHSFNDAVQ